jgi:hypothetical protein
MSIIVVKGFMGIVGTSRRLVKRLSEEVATLLRQGEQAHR